MGGGLSGKAAFGEPVLELVEDDGEDDDGADDDFAVVLVDGQDDDAGVDHLDD